MNELKSLPAETTGSAIATLSTRHEGVMNWLLENPHRSLRECADEMGYSQSWLSQLIHSDIFQAKLRERQESVFVQIAQDIPTKLRGLADQAIEKVSAMLEKTEEPGLAVDIFDKTLNRLGYAPQKGGANTPAPAAQTNVFVVSKNDLAEARIMIAGPAQQPALEAPGDQDSYRGSGGSTIELTASVSTES